MQFRHEIFPCVSPERQWAECYFWVPSILEHAMVTNRDTVSLTNWQKVIGVCLLLFYLAMIVITIATLPYVANVAIPHLTIFVP
jgi:glucan phosphoethanolaminetransferase (alkaline phosphatase superfamily)